jgi:hypothetical protein
MTEDERREFEELRAYKNAHEGKAFNRAFARLETLMNSCHDPMISVRAFRTITECLMVIKERLEERE